MLFERTTRGPNRTAYAGSSASLSFGKIGSVDLLHDFLTQYAFRGDGLVAEVFQCHDPVRQLRPQAGLVFEAEARRFPAFREERFLDIGVSCRL